MEGRCLHRWAITLPAGETHEFVPEEWADTLVVVERGELEIECGSGRCARFPAGSVLTFAALPLRFLHNRGSEPVVISAVRRRRPDVEAGPASSAGSA